MSPRNLRVWQHGTRTGYRHGCPCAACVEAERSYQRHRNRKRPKPPRIPSPVVDDAPPLPDDPCQLYRLERDKRVDARSAALEAVIAEAKTQLDREISHALTVGRSGRPRKSPHIPCLSEAA